MMYIARVLQNREPSVHPVDDYEYVFFFSGDKSTHARIKRAPWSWSIKSFGRVGGAAIGYTPGQAIGAAKCVLESILIKQAENMQTRKLICSS